MRSHRLRAAAGNIATGSSAATTFMPLGTSNMTFELWAKPNGFLTTPFNLYRKTSSNATRNSFTFLLQFPFLVGIVVYSPESDSGTSTTFTTGANTFSTGTWQHLVFTHDTSIGQVKVYNNTTLIETNTDTTNWSSYPNNNSDTYFLTVGKGDGFTYSGDISIVRIYKDKALTASEVTQNYNSEKGRYTTSSSSGTHITNNLVFHIDAGNTNSYNPNDPNNPNADTEVNSLVGNITNSNYNSNISHSTSDGGYWTFTSSTGNGIEFDSI